MNARGYVKYHFKDRIVLFQKRVQLFFWKKQQPILIFTMAKVGSLSVYFSLKKSVSNIALFHVHSLDANDAEIEKEICFENGVYPGSRSVIPLLNKEIIDKNRSFKIISLFRDPIERNLSAFFEAFELHVGIKAEEYTGSLQALEAIYHEELEHDYPIHWFDRYFFSKTEIDIYKREFSSTEGAISFVEKNIPVLIMNASLPDEKKETLLQDFMGVQQIELKNRNITSESKAGQLYKEFKNYMKFEASYLDAMYNSKYAIHFFSETYRENAIKRWLK